MIIGRKETQSNSLGNTVAYVILHFDIENYEVSFCVTLQFLFILFSPFLILTY